MKRLFSISILITSLLLPCHAQTVPNAAMQQAMQRDETAFLQALSPTLQHTQAIAVRTAMQGDARTLQQIRESRNVAPTLPDGVRAITLSPTMTLFKSTQPSQEQRPVLLYLHGGGWCFGSINSCTRFCAAVAKAANICVVALNYRLTPEHPYPAPLDDCRMAFYYLKRHAAEFGGDTTRVSIGGDSAGGNLAIATTMTVGGKSSVHRLLPIYPVTELFTHPTTSWLTYAQGYGDDAELLEAFNEAYARGQQQNPLVSVGLATDESLQQLPPILLISAGHDILFDQTATWANRLQSLGHSVSYHVFPTATHLFITVPGQPTAFNEAVQLTAKML